MMDDLNLARFLVAQKRHYETALMELNHGRKESHWMWFVFPQIAGIGFSPIARHFAIVSSDEARAYLEHPILGVRLISCSEALLKIQGRTAYEIFGAPDDIKGSSQSIVKK